MENVLKEENRGKYHRENIFDIFPDFDNDFFEFTIDQVSQNNAKFTTDILYKFTIEKLNKAISENKAQSKSN